MWTCFKRTRAINERAYAGHAVRVHVFAEPSVREHAYAKNSGRDNAYAGHALREHSHALLEVEVRDAYAENAKRTRI
jgi:hypothetical protein